METYFAFATIQMDLIPRERGLNGPGCNRRVATGVAGSILDLQYDEKYGFLNALPTGDLAVSRHCCS